jgi:CO/xanthine dehydrogenase Mo-binding subunit
MSETYVLGLQIPSMGSREIITGEAKYTCDLSFPSMLVGKLLYTQHPCARIIKIDTSQAKFIPGVVTVLTYKDIPGKNSYTVYDTDQPVLAEDYIRYQGDVLAAVAAETEQAAQAALKVIKVEYKVLPGVFDAKEAMKPGSRQVWQNRNNIYDHLVIEHGNLEEGFKQADIVIENTYTTPRIEHAFLEPEGAVARIDTDGTVIVYAGCQAPFRDRNQIARSLGLPEKKVRVIVPFIGGAFGGKDEVHVQIYTALLAFKTGRPVRLIRTREESIRTHVKRHPTTIRIRSGATKDGLLTALEVEAVGDTGPYVNMGKQVMHVLANHVSGPYIIPNARIEAYTVFTNNPICGAMRGFGMPQAHFACECQMNALAKALGLDPLEIRLRNGLRNGSELATGVTVSNGDDVRHCLEKAAELTGYRTRNNDPKVRQPAPYLRRGWGIACMIDGISLGRNVPDDAGIEVEMARDGSVVVRTGAVDYGQGLHTVLLQLATETLGVKLSDVKLVTPDTEKTVDAGSTSASRQTFVSGNALLKAVEPIRCSLLQTAVEETGLSEDLLSLRNGFLYAEGENLEITVGDLAAKALMKNRKLYSLGHYATVYHNEAFSKDSYPNACEYYTFGAQVARVLVDTETGEVTVEEIQTVADAGKIMNLGGAVGQLEGGTSMGFGYTLMEDLIVKEGRTLNNSLESYLIPTARDVPVMKTSIRETPEINGPLGARALGEAGVIPVVPAIVNAVSDALDGVDLKEIPITPERVLAAIQAQKRI